MSTDAQRFLGKFSDLTHKALGAAFEVSNELGIGFLGKSYDNTLVFDLSSHGIKVDQQKQF
ncbi:GxxExxY protein [Candidatus Pelagisphaera phototrophica]|uniref:GxxExxY protein n=1 Tax=Candidatus Pelagisphaera phototrophica TaxID=2684113 RepID=UPI0019EB2101|nr:GxxExxY protein [Candidatus Pelagisphaera phototrophica]QXD31591.1 GxxExxY protein [Candidatus Pelagisphaera phototrophica]|tara:strand:- start:143 stop:325 length:183 start_codon:yes stop_codon:yes gene_type:complete